MRWLRRMTTCLLRTLTRCLMPSDKDPKPVKVKPTKAKAKQWLKDKGHKSKDVDGAIDGALNTVETGVRAIHRVTDEQYQAAKQ
jgi:hypothetical protein